MNLNKSIFFSSLIALLVGALISGGVTYAVLTNNVTKTTDSNGNVINEVSQYQKKVEESELIKSINDVYDGVVLIENYAQNGSIQGTGTGFFYKQDDKYAYIATNHHVIAEASNVNLLYHDGTTVTNVEIVGSDELSDIAVLKIPKEKAGKILTLGDSSTLKLGQTVFTVGSPLGSEFINTVTHGIISGINRSITVGNSEMMVLQTDAPINPGNSGGPLLNLAGEVIGINSLKIVQEQVEGMGFSIPINEAIKYINDIEKNGKVIRPTFGIQSYNIEDLTPFARNEFSISDSIKYGLFVVDVIKNSPADKAKIQKGDVIIGLNDAVINNINDFRKELYANKIGDKVTAEIIRNGKKMKIEVTLDNSPIE